MNGTRFFAHVFFALGLAVLITACSDPDKNKLLFRPKLDSQRNVNLTQATSFTMKMMGMEMTLVPSTDVSYVMAATSADEAGVVSLDVTYDSVRTEMTGMEGMLQDMPNMPNVPVMEDLFGVKAVQKALDTIKGESFTARVSRQGEVLTVEGADAIADKIVSACKLPVHLPATEIARQLRAQFGNEGTKEFLQRIFVKAPDKALLPGDTWQETMTDDELGMTSELTYTVRERVGESLALDATAQYTVDISKMPGVGQMAGSGGTGKLEGQGTGTFTVEDLTGWPREGVITMKASGTAAPMQGMQIPIEIAAKIEVRSHAK